MNDLERISRYVVGEFPQLDVEAHQAKVLAIYISNQPVSLYKSNSAVYVSRRSGLDDLGNTYYN